MAERALRFETSPKKILYRQILGLISGGVLIGLAVYFLIIFAALPIILYVAILIIFIGVLTMAIAIYVNQAEVVEMGGLGIRIEKGSKIKEATWPEIGALETLMDVDLLGDSRYPRPTLIIETRRWKHKLPASKFPEGALKDATTYLAYHVKAHTLVNDTLDWIREVKETRPCPTCNCKMKYYKEYNRWYCENCRQYQIV